MGASADTWDYAKTYLTIVSFAGPFVLISNCYSNVIRAEGQSGKAMMGQLLGNLLNVVLDPLMILGFHWNIAGAAIATVIGNIAGASYYILYFLRGNSSLSIRLKDFSVKDIIASGVLVIGVPAALGSLLMSVSSIIMNAQMTQYGDMAVAAVGVAMKVTMMTGMFCIGLGQGIIYIPAMFLLGTLFHETGLIWAQPVADVLSLLLAVILYARKSRKMM